MNGKRFAALGQIAVLVLFAALLGAWMYHINLNSQRMDVSALSNGAPLPENGPVLLTGGQTSYQDEDGHACYIMTLHWDGVSYLYFPRARNISINGSAQGILPAYRGYTYQLEPGQENDGIYEIVISSPYARLLPLERCVYFGSYEQISDFLDFSVMVNTYVQGMCFAVMLLSAVLFLFKRSEYYLIWLVLLAFFRGSYYRLRSILSLFMWLPGVSVLLDATVYLILSEILAAFLQYKIMESFVPVKIGKLDFPWYALIAALPVLVLHTQPYVSALAGLFFYAILYTCYLICFLRLPESAVVERSLLLPAWALTVLLRFFEEFCELGLIPSGDLNIKLRMRGILSILFILAFFVVVGKRFAQKFQEADDLNIRLEEEIQRKARQQTVFVRSMLHNMKTPLFSLSGYSDMALDAVDKNPEQARKYMEKAREKAILAGEMMDRIFLVTQMNADMVQMQLAPVNMEELLKGVADTPTAGEENKSLSIKLELLPDVYVQGDALYLRQAFQNLVDNARVSTPDGGSICLRMELVGDALLVHVQDSGCGIDPEELDKIFEAYYSNRHGGRQSSGLGLYITQEIIKRHNGSIRVESGPDQGSDFQVSLPLPSVKI